MWPFLFVFLAGSASVGSGTRSHLADGGRDVGDAFFPLTEGTTWIYEGQVRWTGLAPKEVRAATMTWEMKVMETFKRAFIHAALLRGHPGDLAWYEEGREPGRHLILRIGRTKFYRLGGKRCDEALEKLRNRESLVGILTETNPFIDLPLLPREIYGETGQLTRSDGMYCWRVLDEYEADLSNIKGIGDGEPRTVYQVRWGGLPDHTVFWFAPGVGIIRYVYSHHGTVSDVDVRLTEFRSGAR
jgi:hypothetical protein